MISKIIKKWRDYQDRRLLKRLNRVFANHILESDVVTVRDVLMKDKEGKLRVHEFVRDGKFSPIVKEDDGSYRYL